MIKKLTRHGNSLALILDKPILEILGIDSDTPLSIRTDGTNLIVSPVRDPKREGRFRKALAEGNRAYEKALRNLAE